MLPIKNKQNAKTTSLSFILLPLIALVLSIQLVQQSMHYAEMLLKNPILETQASARSTCFWLTLKIMVEGWSRLMLI
jgi:uncharacterized protein YcfJ